jgi:hypothetical protein
MDKENMRVPAFREAIGTLYGGNVVEKVDFGS